MENNESDTHEKWKYSKGTLIKFATFCLTNPFDDPLKSVLQLLILNNLVETHLNILWTNLSSWKGCLSYGIWNSVN